MAQEYHHPTGRYLDGAFRQEVEQNERMPLIPTETMPLTKSQQRPAVSFIKRTEKWVFLMSIVAIFVTISLYAIRIRRFRAYVTNVTTRLDEASAAITSSYDRTKNGGPARRMLSVFEDVDYIPSDWHLQQATPSISAATAKRMPDIPAQAVLCMFAEQARLVSDDVDMIRRTMLGAVVSAGGTKSSSSSPAASSNPLNLMQITMLMSTAGTCHARLDMIESNLPPATLRAVTGFDAGDMRIRIRTYMESIDAMCRDAVARASGKISVQPAQT